MAIELISTVKPKNNGTFPIVEANDIKGGYYSVESIEIRDTIPEGRRMPGMLCYVWRDKIYKLQDDLVTWEEFVVGTSGEGGGGTVTSNGIWIGTSEPPNDSYVLWIDTSDESLDESFSSLVINEFKSILTSLSNRIIKLERDVAYLKQFHGDTPDIPDVPVDPDVPPTPTTNDTLLVNENGFLLINEKGQILCGNTNTGTITTTRVLVNEDGSILTNENGQILCLDLIQVDNTQIMINENDDILVNENGDILCFHIGTSNDTTEIMVNENDQILVNENGDILCLNVGIDTNTDKVLTNGNGQILVNENDDILCLEVYNMLLVNEDKNILVNEDNNILKL